MVEGLVSFITTSVRGEQLERLFVQPYAVVAILRSLPPLARHMLLRLASTAGTVPAGKRSGLQLETTQSSVGHSVPMLLIVVHFHHSS